MSDIDLNEQATIAYRAMLNVIGATEPTVAQAIRQELADQRTSLKLIASENYASLATLLSMGNWFSDKYAEGLTCDSISFGIGAYIKATSAKPSLNK